jgi:hypothetical protein
VVDQNCSTTRTGLGTTSHNVQGVEGEKTAAPIAMFLQRKETPTKENDLVAKWR